MRIRSGPRLYVTGELGGGRAVDLTAGQTHYLKNVMRLAPGGAVTLFNGRDGEWQGRIDTLGRSAGSAVPEQQTRPQAAEPDLWLLFAPLKRGPLDFLVQKAVELGVSELRPVLTRHTEVGRVNTDRLRAIVLEAAEQCERLTLPQVREPVTLEVALASWPDGRRLLACAEFGPARPIGAVLAEMGAEFAAQSTPATPGSPAALLTGPVGGFTTTELDGLRNLPFVTAVALGPRVLRAETAAIAALACWQSVLGDWRSDRKQTPKAT